jgi:hypothetical protein
MVTKESPQFKMLSARIPVQMHTDIKLWCAKNRTSLQQVLTRVCEIIEKCENGTADKNEQTFLKLFTKE